MAYCPNCISFKEECNPELEDYDKPCSYYKPREEGSPRAPSVPSHAFDVHRAAG